MTKPLSLTQKEVEALSRYYDALNTLNDSMLKPIIEHFSITTETSIDRFPNRITMKSTDLIIRFSPHLDEQEWVFLLAMCCMHLALGHYQARTKPDFWSIAAGVEAYRWTSEFGFGIPPVWMIDLPDRVSGSAELIYEKLGSEAYSAKQVEAMATLNISGSNQSPFILTDDWKQSKAFLRRSEYERDFSFGLIQATADAMAATVGLRPTKSKASARRSKRIVPMQESVWDRYYKTEALKARKRILDNYPLLGALASSFEIIEKPDILRRMDISIAAIDEELKEIYISPGCGFNTEELVFVIAHEMLHVGLRHYSRSKGRDHFLWNIACDYVINDWLIEMKIGEMPPSGLLYDKELHGLSAESVYDIIVKDLRKYRKLGTFAGVGKGDILAPGTYHDAMNLDEFYRKALSQGLQLHRTMKRGLLPAGLEEEIVSLMLPPIPWDVQLSGWFDHHFPPLPAIRSYARANRRQSSTPDIPRPALRPDPREMESYVFGVILDTSGSMSRKILSAALGTIAGFCEARSIRAVRVIHVDADAYDMGWLEPSELVGRVAVVGRGGTILQPAIDLMQKAADFPPDAPLLIITDGMCDVLKIHREHAFLLPEGRTLPFPAKGKTFYIA